MASSSTQLSQPHHQIRSLSLPSKLNPINRRIEEKLKKLRTKEESSTSASEAISIGLSGVAELYECINEVLGLPLTQQALSLRQHERCVGELVKTCSSLVRVCTSAMEIVLQHREMAKEVQLSISNNGRERLNMESIVARYTSSRKELIKKATGVILSLKNLDDRNFASDDNQQSTVTKALRCVSIINISVYESALVFLSMPVLSPKWSLLSKVMNKANGKRGGQAKSKSGNELHDVDVALQTFLSSRKAVDDDHGKFCAVLENLNAFVGVMEGIESGLESVYKQITKTKSFLMNILSF